MPDLLLTPAELAALTGTVQPKRQRDWLDARGWAYEPGARRGDGPRVSRAYAEKRLAGEKPQQQRRAGPDVSWMMGPRRAA